MIFSFRIAQACLQITHIEFVSLQDRVPAEHL